MRFKQSLNNQSCDRIMISQTIIFCHFEIDHRTIATVCRYNNRLYRNSVWNPAMAFQRLLRLFGLRRKKLGVETKEEEDSCLVHCNPILGDRLDEHPDIQPKRCNRSRCQRSAAEVPDLQGCGAAGAERKAFEIAWKREQRGEVIRESTQACTRSRSEGNLSRKWSQRVSTVGQSNGLDQTDSTSTRNIRRDTRIACVRHSDVQRRFRRLGSDPDDPDDPWYSSDDCELRGKKRRRRRTKSELDELRRRSLGREFIERITTLTERSGISPVDLKVRPNFNRVVNHAVNHAVHNAVNPAVNYTVNPTVNQTVNYAVNHAAHASEMRQPFVTNGGFRGNYGCTVCNFQGDNRCFCHLANETELALPRCCVSKAPFEMKSRARSTTCINNWRQFGVPLSTPEPCATSGTRTEHHLHRRTNKGE